MELLEFTGNVALAAVLGTLIGLERQWHQHPAGLRTNALVCIGAALFVSLTHLLGEVNSPSRIASYIVSGVGFLGGGAILGQDHHAGARKWSGRPPDRYSPALPAPACQSVKTSP